ncbi:putative conjugative transfer protein TraH [Orientia chuto str. Dubai]|uniref:Putative conjugative transfer protein TraH n=1 Tax=Orientia chuto str. Dubai TaxID=1359168 RepID=A0A0F3MNQ0_9RICK|nr:putative conjugative transfer protein TraH [Orientia chuto str. Dubai]
MLDDFLIKAAEKAGIPDNMRNSIMSITGTIVVVNNNVNFFDSLAKDEKSRISHLKGEKSASRFIDVIVEVA